MAYIYIKTGSALAALSLSLSLYDSISIYAAASRSRAPGRLLFCWFPAGVNVIRCARIPDIAATYRTADQGVAREWVR